MRFHNVKIANFRNIESAEVKFGERFNLFCGANAQGKTNFLEALYMLSELRSFRSAKVKNLIDHDKEEAFLKSFATASGLDYDINIFLRQNSRKIKVNGKSVIKHRDFLGSLPVVIFTPDDIYLLKGSPDLRRNFLDRCIFLLQPAYWDQLQEYNSYKKRRNQLLKLGEIEDQLFEVYTEKMAYLGCKISYKRSLLVERLLPDVQKAVVEVSSGSEKISLNYQTKLGETPDEIKAQGEQKLLDIYKENLKRDLALGWTSSGAHRDDLFVNINGQLATSFASQGQHRTIALAFKIAETETLNKAHGTFPAFLIDDLSSELDSVRREKLFTYLRKSGGQVFLTSTDEKLAEDFSTESLSRFNVASGKITPIDF